RDRAHPALNPGPVHDVERHDVAPLAAPDHRAVGGIADGVPPHRGIEKGHPHAHHAVAAIAFGERLAEDLIQLVDLLDLRGIRPVDDVAGAPGARGRHQSAAPASAYSSLGASSRSMIAADSASTRDVRVSSSYRTVSTRS